MKTIISESAILFICISSLTFININSTIIKEGYHFFDLFYYRDYYKALTKQKKSSQCSIENGPSCYYIKGKNEDLISSELKKIYPSKETFKRESPENILTKIKEATTLIQGKDPEEIKEEVYSFDTPYMVSLYLTFESYDEKTKYNDIYAPEIIDNQYEAGRLTLTITGKLRLTQKNAELYESKGLFDLRDEGPKKTYAYVESKEVIFKFSSKSSINSLYIKKNKFNKNNKTFFLYGYKNGHRHIITKVENVPSYKWVRVNGNGEKYDYIGLIRGFDYDNFVINAVASKNDLNDLNKLTKKYSTAFNEKINEVITKLVGDLKSEDFKSIDGDNIGNIKVVQIHLNQNDMAQETDDNDFEIPEEIMDEINKNEKIKNDNSKKRNDNTNINKHDL
jgi:hypothetical protein